MRVLQSSSSSLAGCVRSPVHRIAARWAPSRDISRTLRVFRSPRAQSEQGESVTTKEAEQVSPAPSPSPSPSPSPPPAVQEEPAPPNNALLAGGAAVAGVALFLFTRLGTGASFADLENGSVPLDVALTNGKPTVVEFYANWCEVCREMLPDALAMQAQYAGKVNYVALNVENTKWVPEMLEYNVDGIPHFEFLDAQRQEQAVAIGRLPRKVLEADVAALSEGTIPPYTRVVKETSSMKRPDTTMSGPSPKQTMPKDHS